MSDTKELTRDELRSRVKDSYPRLFPQDVDLYIDECARRGVHPLSRLMVPRPNIGKDRDGSWVRKGPPAWIVTIDLMRAKADQTGTYVPGDEPKFEYDDKNGLISAKAFVRKLVGNQVVMFSESADWSEYYPGEGLEGAMWRKMPRVMLSKVAEARALRKGWPAQLHGLYEGSEMDQADTPVPAANTAPATTPPPTEKDPLEDNHNFLMAVGSAGLSRGSTQEIIRAWWRKGLEDNNATVDSFSLEDRQKFIAEIKAGKFDEQLKPKAPAGGQTLREKFVAAAAEMQIDEEGANAAYDRWLMRSGFKNNEAKIPPGKRESLIAALRADQFDYAKGQIVEAAVVG